MPTFLDKYYCKSGWEQMHLAELADDTSKELWFPDRKKVRKKYTRIKKSVEDHSQHSIQNELF